MVGVCFPAVDIFIVPRPPLSCVVSRARCLKGPVRCSRAPKPSKERNVSERSGGSTRANKVGSAFFVEGSGKLHRLFVDWESWPFQTTQSKVSPWGKVQVAEDEAAAAAELPTSL